MTPSSSKDSIKSKRKHLQYINLTKDSVRMHKELLGKRTEQAHQKMLSKKSNNTQKAFKLISHYANVNQTPNLRLLHPHQKSQNSETDNIRYRWRCEASRTLTHCWHRVQTVTTRDRIWHPHTHHLRGHLEGWILQNCVHDMHYENSQHCYYL